MWLWLATWQPGPHGEHVRPACQSMRGSEMQQCKLPNAFVRSFRSAKSACCEKASVKVAVPPHAPMPHRIRVPLSASCLSRPPRPPWTLQSDNSERSRHKIQKSKQQRIKIQNNREITLRRHTSVQQVRAGEGKGFGPAHPAAPMAGLAGNVTLPHRIKYLLTN